MKLKITYHDANMPIKEVIANVASVGENNLSKLSMVKNIEKQTKERISRIEKLRMGVTGIAKATLGIGLASKSEIEGRRSICEVCEFRQGSSCGACGCFISPKTKLAKEQCPKGFWGQAITIENQRSGGCGCGKNK